MEKVKKKKKKEKKMGVVHVVGTGQISEVSYFDLYENEKQRGDMMA